MTAPAVLAMLEPDAGEPDDAAPAVVAPAADARVYARPKTSCCVACLEQSGAVVPLRMGFNGFGATIERCPRCNTERLLYRRAPEEAEQEEARERAIHAARMGTLQTESKAAYTEQRSASATARAQLGLASRREGSAVPLVSPEQGDEYMRRVLAGEPPNTVARAVGVGRTTMRKALQAACARHSVPYPIHVGMRVLAPVDPESVYARRGAETLLQFRARLTLREFVDAPRCQPCDQPMPLGYEWCSDRCQRAASKVARGRESRRRQLAAQSA